MIAKFFHLTPMEHRGFRLSDFFRISWIRISGFLLLFFFVSTLEVRSADWIRAGLTTNEPVWGLQSGLQFALHPFGFHRGKNGPRGLIRVGYPVLEKGGYSLINYIAVEPIVNGKKGYSELERSKLDGDPGKRFWLDDTPKSKGILNPGKISKLGGGVEQLDVIVRVEKFDNGAHVFLTLSQRSDAPDELQLTIHSENDSAPMEFCILTATMGNFARLRQLWLKDKVVSSRELYPDYRGVEFAPATHFPLEQLRRTADGDVVLAATTDEKNPAVIFPLGDSRRWFYDGEKVTQYWKKKKGTYRETLEGVANARYTYWKSRQSIPGGIAFENIEMCEFFYSGQQFIFGITRQTPMEMKLAK
ncbi:MAG: hypothetical protein M3Y82_00795 [Verrucomicrobiota bacterium]|nr:hypothetical protein [Verrucomicrobiota bacterium]